MGCYYVSWVFTHPCGYIFTKAHNLDQQRRAVILARYSLDLFSKNQLQRMHFGVFFLFAIESTFTQLKPYGIDTKKTNADWPGWRACQGHIVQLCRPMSSTCHISWRRKSGHSACTQEICRIWVHKGQFRSSAIFDISKIISEYMLVAGMKAV